MRCLRNQVSDAIAVSVCLRC